MHDTTAEPICLRTPDRLHRYDVVELDDQPPSQVVRIYPLAGGYLVRTLANIHLVEADTLVKVCEVAVPGIGLVTAAAVA